MKWTDELQTFWYYDCSKLLMNNNILFLIPNYYSKQMKILLETWIFELEWTFIKRIWEKIPNEINKWIYGDPKKINENEGYKQSKISQDKRLDNLLEENNKLRWAESEYVNSEKVYLFEIKKLKGELLHISKQYWKFKNETLNFINSLKEINEDMVDISSIQNNLLQ